MRDMGETLRDTFDRVFKIENRRRAPRQGKFEKLTISGRTVSVYLPPGYDKGEQPYPVLYMQDGQNMFEAQRAFGGTPWRIDAAADQVIGERRARPMIIVGVDHAGAGRIDEFTPTHDESKKAGGKADDYARLLLEDIRPAIDQRYSTSQETSIGGSSLGGLASLYLALRFPHIFDSAAVMSPSVWWHNQAVLRFVEHFQGEKRPKFWVDIGGREGAEAIAGARALRAALEAKGWGDAELHYEEDKRAEHTERAWSRRIPRALEFLFPPV